MPPDDIGAKVKAARLEKGWSQERLAMLARTTRATIDRIEHNRFNRSYRLRDVLAALGLPDEAESREQRRIRERLIEEGIPEEYAAEAARIVVAERLLPPLPPAPPTKDERAAG